MCGCKKVVKKTECQRLRIYHEAKDTFVYRVVDEVFIFRKIDKGRTPLEVLKKDKRFLNNLGEVEFYYTNEHPCLKK